MTPIDVDFLKRATSCYTGLEQLCCTRASGGGLEGDPVNTKCKGVTSFWGDVPTKIDQKTVVDLFFQVSFPANPIELG